MKILLLFLLLGARFEASIQDHLKKVQKGPISGIEQVDFVYLINLDQRPEKWRRSLSQLKAYGISPCRFSAICGWDLPRQVINDIGLRFQSGMKGGDWACHYPLDPNQSPQQEFLLKSCYEKIYFHSMMKPGAMGCTLSHLSVLQDAYDSNYQTIWVMEDDICVVENPHQLSDLMERLSEIDPNWDILYTDHDKADAALYLARNDFESDLKGLTVWSPDLPNLNGAQLRRRQVVSDDFIKIGMRYRTHSMLLRRSGIEKILDYKKKHPIFNGYDVEVALVPGIRMYMLRKNIVTFVPSPSDTFENHFKN